MDLDLGWSSCGLSYADRTRCAQPVFNIAEVCGNVVDSAGAAISKADIWIVKTDDTSKIVSHIKSDSNGYFALPKSLSVKYTLIIKAVGFNPWFGQIDIGDTGSNKCKRPLKVTLGIMSECSKAEY